MGKDEWVRAAMTDDTVVVELLIRLKQAQAEAVSSKPHAVIPLRWGMRLPRSKSASVSSALRCENNDINSIVVVSRKKEGDSSTRCSPTTPLSWSGGGGSSSPSGTGDGFEETSRRSSPAVRSKLTSETASTNNTKRSRRKKTFAELRMEEGLLMKEKMHLKKELASLNATFNEHRSRNENLKRIKLDLNLQYAENSSFGRDEIEEAICSPSHRRETSSSNHIISMLPMYAKLDDNTQSGSCQTHEIVSDPDKSFLLPDLNMMPTEDPAGESLPEMR